MRDWLHNLLFPGCIENRVYRASLRRGRSYQQGPVTGTPVQMRFQQTCNRGHPLPAGTTWCYVCSPPAPPLPPTR